MNNEMTTLAPLFLNGSSSFLQGISTTLKSRMGSKFGKIGPWTAELAALERLGKSPYTYNGRNVVTTLVPSLLDGSSSFLQVTSIIITARTSLNSAYIPSPTME